LAAHRVGYAIAHPELTAVLEKVRLPYNLPAFSQAAALTVLTHRQALLQSIPEILEQRKRVTQALLQYPNVRIWSSAANFIYLRLRQEFTDRDSVLREMHQQLKSQGTLIRQISDGFRITIGSYDENTRMLSRLHKALENL
jgi:histidinol-phosphate aminotransferase